MSDYRVRIIRTAGLRQAFHVRLESTNGKVLMISEKYRDHSYALHMGSTLAGALNGNLIDETESTVPGP